MPLLLEWLLPRNLPTASVSALAEDVVLHVPGQGPEQPETWAPVGELVVMRIAEIDLEIKIDGQDVNVRTIDAPVVSLDVEVRALNGTITALSEREFVASAGARLLFKIQFEEEEIEREILIPRTPAHEVVLIKLGERIISMSMYRPEKKELLELPEPPEKPESEVEHADAEDERSELEQQKGESAELLPSGTTEMEGSDIAHVVSRALLEHPAHAAVLETVLQEVREPRRMVDLALLVTNPPSPIAPFASKSTLEAKQVGTAKPATIQLSDLLGAALILRSSLPEKRWRDPIHIF